MSTVHAKVIWSELMSRDYEASKKFFADVLGWTYNDMEQMGGNYTSAVVDGEEVVGIGNSIAMKIPDDIPSHWMTYIGVDDIDAVVTAVEASGGTVKNPPFDVPNVGKFAIIADPSGAVFGFIQPNC